MFPALILECAAQLAQISGNTGLIIATKGAVPRPQPTFINLRSKLALKTFHSWFKLQQTFRLWESHKLITWVEVAESFKPSREHCDWGKGLLCQNFQIYALTSFSRPFEHPEFLLTMQRPHRFHGNDKKQRRVQQKSATTNWLKNKSRENDRVQHKPRSRRQRVQKA